MSAERKPPDPRTIKALAFDLDGTILGPGAVLSSRTIKTVNKCIQRGLKIILNTGRAIEGAERFRASLGVEGPMIYFNGAVVAEMPGRKILKRTLLDTEAAKFCARLSRETGAYFQVFLSDERMTLVTEQDGPDREMYHNHTGILAEIRDLKETLRAYENEGCVKLMFIAEPEKMALIRPRLEEQLGKTVYITKTQFNFLELMNIGVSKGRGLKFVMERLSLKREEVMAFGDDENDIPMFPESGFSVAPLNAKDSVKAQADLVVGSNTDEGVIAFVEEFLGL